MEPDSKQMKIKLKQLSTQQRVGTFRRDEKSQRVIFFMVFLVPRTSYRIPVSNDKPGKDEHTRRGYYDTEQACR